MEETKMCEFCTKHGEGKKWYLQMKNYADELIHEELSPEQSNYVGASTRYEWFNRYFEYMVMPAVGSTSESQEDSQDDLPSPEFLEPQISEDDFLAYQKVTHFGQVLPIEDVYKVIDMVDSITTKVPSFKFEATFSHAEVTKLKSGL